MPDTRRLRPVLRVGQRTSQTYEFRLVDTDGDPIDVTGADVSLTMEHDRYAYTAVEGGDATIVDGDAGVVAYEFSAAETSLHGRYRVQFEVDYGDATELVPPEDDRWVLDVGRRIPKTQPLSVPRVSADEGTFTDLQVTTIDIEHATIRELVDDPDIDELSINSLNATELAGGIVGDRGPLTRLDGSDLYIDENGQLAWSNPTTDGYTEGGDHDHSETGSGGDVLRPVTAIVAEELGLPEYDDVANAPQTQGRVVYATGDGTSTEGIYKHDGTSYSPIDTGLLDGEDFDGQDTSSFQNLEAVGTRELNDTAWIESTDGATAVQSAFDDGYTEVFVTGGPAEWTDTVEVPEGCTLERVGNGEIRVPDTHSLTEYDKNGDTVCPLITNAPGASDVTVTGGTYDVSSNGGKDLQKSFVGVWLDDTENSDIKDVSVTGVGGDADWDYARSQCILISDSDDSTITDCYANNGGYEGIGVRGQSNNISVVDCYAEECGRYGYLAGTWKPTKSGIPNDVEFINCDSPDGMDWHGGNSADGLRRMVNMKAVACDLDRIQVLDDNRHAKILGCTLTRVWVRNPTADTQVDRLNVAHCTFPREDSFSPIQFTQVEDNFSATRIYIESNAAYGRRFMEIESAGTGGVLGDVHIQNNTFTGDYTDDCFIEATGGMFGSQYNFTVKDNDITSVATMFDGDMNVKLRDNKYPSDATLEANGATVGLSNNTVTFPGGGTDPPTQDFRHGTIARDYQSDTDDTYINVKGTWVGPI